MKLPKIDLPIFRTILPVSKKEISYRPYTTKEEKILMFAAQSENETESMAAIIQVLENCASVDAHSLHPTDLEWLYIKIRSSSVGSTIDVQIDLPEKCSGKDEVKCPGIIQSGINLDGIQVNTPPISAPKKGDDYIIMLTDSVGVAIQPKAVEDNFLYNSLSYVFDSKSVYPKSSFTPEEFAEWYDGMPSAAHKSVEDFIENQPTLYYDLKAKCHVCGLDIRQQIRGLTSFFG